MTFNSSLSCLMSKVSIEITINTSKWHERAKQWNGNSHISSQVDRFSLHCNSIQSTVSIVHLRVILTYLIPLLRVYINQHSSNAIQFQLVQQCDYIYQNKFFNVHTYILCLFYIASSIRISILIDPLGLLTHNATWCQNRCCICISSVRRTYGRIHMLPAYIQSSRQVQ